MIILLYGHPTSVTWKYLKASLLRKFFPQLPLNDITFYVYERNIMFDQSVLLSSLVLTEKHTHRHAHIYVDRPIHTWDESGSSVSTVSGYGLDDRAIEVLSPAGAKNFSCSLCVQTSSGAHPASCTMGTGGPFPGATARPGRDADHSPLSSAEVENRQKLYLLSPQAPSWRVVGQL
jgi:hypothetical protein